jgi:hypothetical protein
MDLSWLLQQGDRTATDAAHGNNGQFTGTALTGNSDPQSQDTLQKLAQLQSFDPNASIQAIPGEQGGQSYQFKFDPTKVPTAPTDSAGNAMSQYLTNSQLNANTKQQYGQGMNPLAFTNNNPSAVTHDSTFGDITNESNYSSKELPGKTTALDILGPLLPMLAMPAFGALGAGLDAAGAASAGAAFGGGDVGVGSSAFGNAASKAALSVPGQLNAGKFNPMSLSGMALAGLNLPPSVLAILNAARYIPTGK